MKALRKLYTANLNNEVAVFATNLSDFVEALRKHEPDAPVRNYQYYYREFLKSSLIPLAISEGKVYTLQEVFNAD